MDIETIIQNKLTGKFINKLAFIIYQNLNDKNYDFITHIISHYHLLNIINTKNNGLISNIILFYIFNSNTDKIIEIISICESFEDFSLMKRDFLQISKYFYSIDKTFAINIFTNNILKKVLHNPEFLIQTKDIDFIISHKMYDILILLNNTFITSTISDLTLTIPPDLHKIFLPTDVNHFIISKIELDIQDYIISLNKKFLSITHDINVIIDGGNILHHIGGVITKQAVHDLIKLINYVKINIGNPLVILHQKHFKKIKSLKIIFDSLNISYYQTPYGHNDDNFIMWFFLKFNTIPLIISNDKYRDHIFRLETSSKTNLFSLTLFKNIIEQQVIPYFDIDNIIQHIKKYSFCIQVIDNKIYIPHVSGNFIEIIQ